MSQPTERIRLSSNYIYAIGRATYNFAYLEWGIIWLYETIDRGFLVKSRSLTAGQIAKSFLEVVDGLNPSDTGTSAIVDVAKAFDELVVDRNRLMHGNPFTASEGEQHLAYHGKHGKKEWSLEEIDAFSDRLADISIEAGKILHGGRYGKYRSDRMNG